MRTIKTTIVLAIIAFSTGLAPVVTAQKVNSLYFLDRTPIHARLNPAMSPKTSGFGIGISNISMYVQSDLAFTDIFQKGQNGEPLSILSPGSDRVSFINNLNDVSSFRTGMNMELFTLGIRARNTYFSFHSGMNMDMGMGLPKDMFKLILLGTDKDAQNTTFNLTDMNMDAMMYNKTGVGFSMKIGSLLSVGANVDYLAGLANTKLSFNELTVNASQTQWDVTSKGVIQVTGPDFYDLEYDEEGYLSGIKMDDPDYITANMNSLPIAGKGLSFDLGVTAKPLPFITVSAAISDIGSIKWNKQNIKKASSNGTFTYEGMELSLGEDEENNDETEDNQLLDELTEMVHFSEETVTEGYSTPLTTKLNLGAEAGLLNNRITFGVLSQTGFTPNGSYNDVMLSANLKPGSIIQTALTYSLLHGEMSSFGAAVNMKLLFLNAFLAADYIPVKYNPQMIPLNNSYFNFQFGFNFMF